MTDFTPGPWETSRDAVPDGYVQVSVYADLIRVATVFEAEANARLIAAAPDLLAALQAADGFFTRGRWADEAVDAVRAAIAKATGE